MEDCNTTYRQWLAVRTWFSSTMLAPHWKQDNPQHSFSRHCHGHECLRASVPPTMRDETSGSIVGLPQFTTSTSTESQGRQATNWATYGTSFCTLMTDTRKTFTCCKPFQRDFHTVMPFYNILADMSHFAVPLQFQSQVNSCFIVLPDTAWKFIGTEMQQAAVQCTEFLWVLTCLPATGLSFHSYCLFLFLSRVSTITTSIIRKKTVEQDHNALR